MAEPCLPPLYLDPTWESPRLPLPQFTGYKLKDSKQLRLSFPTDIFGCFGIQDTGANCFCAHCCCGPCIYDSAMRFANVKGSGLAATATVFANALPSGEQGGSDAAKSAANAAAAFARARVRQTLIAKFYPEGYSEGYVLSGFYHCCCPSCAWCQEVNAVMVWSVETKGMPLYYGDWSQCKCGQLVNQSGALVYSAEMTPSAGLMERV